MPVNIHYACTGCGAGATVSEGHLRVNHHRTCKKWKKIQRRFPGLAEMKRIDREG